MVSALVAASQVPSPVPRPVTGVTVSGMVYDSLVAAPLRGALVQLAAADSATSFGSTQMSDSLGRFTFAGVPDGSYLLSFYHPILDSIFVEPEIVRLAVAGRAVVQDLSLPSPARVHSAVCGPSASPDGAVVTGVVRDALTFETVPGVRVTGEWLELSLERGRVGRRMPRLVATTGNNGWFALCDVPKGGTMAIVAARGADSTDRVEMSVPASGFARGDLFLGTTGSAGIATRGTVVIASGNLPLVAAQVAIGRVARAVTNDRGEWSIDNTPPGTRMMDIRAVGFVPVRLRVDVVAHAPPVQVRMSTVKALLDTIRVTASRVRSVDLEGFRSRMRSGVGHFLTAEDIARRNAQETTDIFRTMPGLQVDAPKGSAQATITMRGLWAQWPGGIPRCLPLIFLDGNYMGDSTVTADDIDNYVRPQEIAGIEVYTQGEVPPQYSRGMTSGCGSILIWSKPRR